MNQSLQKLRQPNGELLKVCPTGEEFITRFNFDFCLSRYENIDTIEKAIESGMLTLREISDTYNKKTPVLMLQAWLVNLSSFMNFEITAQQAKETAQYIFEEMRAISLPLLTILFKRIKKGKYGEFYGKFNGQKILIACIDFRKEIMKEVIKIEEQKQLRSL